MTRKTSIQFHTAGEPTLVKHNDGALTVAIPIRVKRYSGRKQVLLPSGVAMSAVLEAQELTTLQAALAKGHRWLRMLEDGKVASLKDIAEKEQIDERYVARFVNLTTLAPDIVAAILDETLPENVTLADLGINPPLVWEEQRRRLGINGGGN